MATVSNEAQYVLRRMEYFLENNQSFKINQRQYPHLLAVASLTLEDLKVATFHQFQKKLVGPLELQKGIQQLERFFPFYKRLSATASETLKKVSLFHLQTAKELKRLDRSIVWIVLAPKEQIASIPIKEVAELGDAEISHLCGRLEKEEMPESAADTVGRLRASCVQEIAFSSLPLKAFRLLSKEQFAQLNFSHLSKEEVREALRGSGRAIGERWRALSKEQRSEVWKSARRDLLEHFPREFYPEIDSITRGQLEDLFPPKWDTFSETNRERFALLTPAQVSRWIPLFWNWHIDLITDEQVRGLDFSSLKNEKIVAILSRQRGRIALLSSEAREVVSRKLGESYLSELSMEQATLP